MKLAVPYACNRDFTCHIHDVSRSGFHMFKNWYTSVFNVKIITKCHGTFINSEDITFKRHYSTRTNPESSYQLWSFPWLHRKYIVFIVSCCNQINSKQIHCRIEANHMLDITKRWTIWRH